MFHIKRPLSPAIGAIALVPVLVGVDCLYMYWVHMQNAPPHIAETVVPPSVTTFPLVRHTWRTAVMARRIHQGMTKAQVVRILGHPYQHEDPICAMPGDVSGIIQFRETYIGRNGPLYVCYRDSSVPPYIVVADASTERKDLGPFFL